MAPHTAVAGARTHYGPRGRTTTSLCPDPEGKSTMTSRSSSKQPVPFLELRVGVLHLTVSHVPYRMLAPVTAVAGGGGATLVLR